jgi:class 3 adenylate cyclase
MNALNDIVDAFLKKYCPDPPAIMKALERASLWKIDDKQAGEKICSEGDEAQACWLIINGFVEVQSGGSTVAFRRAGEIIGEQAFLYLPSGRKYRRTADLVARGPVQLATIDAAFPEKLSDGEKNIWSLTLAAVVNEKLDQATQARALLQQSIDNREQLLRRFADGDALGIVKFAATNLSSPVVERDVIVWFSDIANFSTWASSKDPNEVAAVARHLTELQIELIRKAEGEIDKIMGDGVMAVWFVDTEQRRKERAPKAVACAIDAARKVQELLGEMNLQEQMDIRIGLHSGSAAFGDFGAKERIAVTVLGNTVNMAARYEQAKDKNLGAVRISGDLKIMLEKNSTAKIAFRAPVKVEVKHGVTLDVYSI